MTRPGKFKPRFPRLPLRYQPNRRLRDIGIRRHQRVTKKGTP